MVNLGDRAAVDRIIAEITDQAEVTRRAEAYKRQLIYKDGGKRFLLEQIRREFEEAAVNEMRLCPINLLKKIVNKRASIYKRSPIRRAMDKNDQPLVDYYVRTMQLNQRMQKANRYYILHSNAALYTVPEKTGKICLNVTPPYMYSVSPNQLDRSLIDAHIFSAFTERGRVFDSVSQRAATGREGFSREPGLAMPGKKVDSKQDPATDARQFIFWTDTQHATTNESGDFIAIGESGEKLVEHGLGMSPVVNLAKERDNEAWATDGEDLIDLTMAIQSGWTDLLTIAKQQGFSILTMISEKRPEKMTLGVNKAIWLQIEKEGPTPSLDYKSGASNLGEYRQILMELLGLLLSTNEMNPKAISGVTSTQQFTSGFHALIEMSDTLSAIEDDKPAMMNAETEVWKRIAAWHNKYHDAKTLPQEAQSLGRFSEEFQVAIIYNDPKPLESESDRLSTIKELKDLGLITRQKAMKRLYPDMTDEQIQEELQQIDAENSSRADMIARASAGPVEKEKTENEKEPEEEEEEELEDSEDSED